MSGYTSIVTDLYETSQDDSQQFFAFKALLKTAGWSVVSSGDGDSTYSSSTDIITSAGSGANGLANNRSWWRLQKSYGANTFEMCWQRTITRYIRCKISVAAGFTGGSPDYQTTPSATDEVVLYGSGSDASPVGTQLTANTTSDYVLMAADSAAQKLGCWFAAQNTAALPDFAGAFCIDEFREGYPTAQTFPYALYFDGNASTCWGIASSLGTLASVYHPYAAVGGDPAVAANWAATAMMTYFRTTSGTRVYPRGSDVDAITGDEPGVPIIYSRNDGVATSEGATGWSSSFLWANSANLTNKAVALDQNGKRWVRLYDVWAPWDSTSITGASSFDLYDWSYASAGAPAGSPNYRMRGFDQNVSVNDYVFWDSTEVDSDASDYAGSAGPVVDVIVHRILSSS